jgi:hypothetical protein
MDGRGIWVRFPAGGGDISVLHSVQIGSGTHSVFYPTGTGGLFPLALSDRGVKLTTQVHLVPTLRMVELYLNSPTVFMAWCLINQAQGELYFIIPRERGAEPERIWQKRKRKELRMPFHSKGVRDNNMLSSMQEVAKCRR